MRRSIAIIVAIVLLMSLVIPVMAATSVPALNKVSLGGNSTAEIKQINLFPNGGTKTAAFTLSIYNGGSTDLLFIDYWVKLQSKSGSSFNVKVIDQDKDKNRIAAKTSQDFTFYSEVSNSLDVDDLIVKVIKWDFSVSSFERTLGQISIPTGYTGINATQTAKTLDIDGVKIELSFSDVILANRDGNLQASTNLTLVNKGQRKALIPSTLKVFIQTTEGYVYELSGNFENLSVDPQLKSNVQLKATLPGTLKSQNWKLILVQNDATSKLNIPIAAFPGRVGTSTGGSIASKTTKFSTKAGTYNVKLNGIQKMPWGDEDIITAELVISNPGKITLALPIMTGDFILEGVSTGSDNTKLVQLDNVMNLRAGAEATIILYVKVPYTYEYDDVELILETKDTKEATTAFTVASFKYDTQELALPVIGKDQIHVLDNVGKKANITVEDAYMFNGVESSLFYANLVMENKEKRPSNLIKLEGYIRAEDDSLFPATISTVKSVINPGGKALISVSSVIPDSYKDNKLDIIIGEGVTGAEVTIGDKVADGFVKAAILDREHNVSAPQEALENIKIHPYDFTVKNMYATLDSSTTVRFEFNYDMAKTTSYSFIAEKHKVVIELVSGTFKYEKEFDIDNTEGFKLGIGNGISFTTEDPNITTKVAKNFMYTLNVYDKYGDYKRLVATKQLKWFEIYK